MTNVTVEEIDALIKEGHLFICEAMMIGGLMNQYKKHGALIQKQHKILKQIRGEIDES